MSLVSRAVALYRAEPARVTAYTVAAIVAALKAAGVAPDTPTVTAVVAALLPVIVAELSRLSTVPAAKVDPEMNGVKSAERALARMKPQAKPDAPDVGETNAAKRGLK